MSQNFLEGYTRPNSGSHGAVDWGIQAGRVYTITFQKEKKNVPKAKRQRNKLRVEFTLIREICAEKKITYWNCFKGLLLSV